MVLASKAFVVGNPPPSFGGRYFLFVKLVTDDGIEGVGEVYAATFGPDIVVKALEDVFERCVLRADPFRIEALRNVYGSGYCAPRPLAGRRARAGSRWRCGTSWARRCDRPVYELLGGACTSGCAATPTSTRATSTAADVYLDPRRRRSARAEYVALGFTALKFDPRRPYTTFDPRQPSLEDLDLSDAICAPCAKRSATGRPAVRHPRPVHRVGRDPPGPAARALDPLWFEEPTPPETPEQMAKVARFTSIPIATGERLTTKYEFARVLDRRRLDPADEPRPRRRPAGGEEDRRHGGGALRADRAAPVLRAGGRRGEHPDLDLLHPNFLILEGIGRWDGSTPRSCARRSAGRTAT